MNDERTRVSLARQERRDAIANRERILAVARQLFAEQGVEATSMNQLAQAAHIGPATLYRHFANKGVLCETLLEDDIAAFQQRVAAINENLDALASPLTRLQHIINEILLMLEVHVTYLSAIQEGGRMMGQNISHVSVYTWIHREFIDLLAAARAQGEVTNLDVEFTADMLMAVLRPQLFVFLQQQRGFDRVRIAAGIQRIFIEGLR